MPQSNDGDKPTSMLNFVRLVCCISLPVERQCRRSAPASVPGESEYHEEFPGALMWQHPQMFAKDKHVKPVGQFKKKPMLVSAFLEMGDADSFPLPR